MAIDVDDTVLSNLDTGGSSTRNGLVGRENLLNPTPNILRDSGREERQRHRQACSAISSNAIFFGKEISSRTTKHSENPPVLYAIEKGWKLLDLTDQSPIISSTLVPKFTEHADTNLGFIGITKQKQTPVLMSAKSAKKLSWRPPTQPEEE